jgi:peptide-methionine (S)-S-oxide reductase
MTVGEKVEGVSLDAGWGERNENLVAKIPLKDLEQQGMDVSELQVGVKLQMANGLRCVIAERNEESITIDANPPLAGASYSATVELLNIEDGPSELEYTEDSSDNKYQVATFALGCFWGGELKMARQIGVVGTSVGFTQGKTENPTYEQVCSGTTGHTEAIQVIFDETGTSGRW